MADSPGKYAFGMAMRLRLDPELAAAVERARRLASEAGELTPGGGAPFETVISPEVGAAIGSLLRDGTTYQDLGGNYFDERDRGALAQRLIGRLKKLGVQVTIKTRESTAVPAVA